MRMPTGTFTVQRINFLGLPVSINGATPVPPFNGLLNVSVPCMSLQASGNWPSYPRTVTTTLGSYWATNSIGTFLIRLAQCKTTNCLDWTWLPAPGDAVAE